jgi:hypothetical protein
MEGQTMIKLKAAFWPAALAMAFACIGAIKAGSAADANESGRQEGKMERKFEEDVIKTDTNDLKVTFIGHGTLMFTYSEKVVHVDPWSRLVDYSKMPKARLILITHEHRDHLDTKALAVL